MLSPALRSIMRAGGMALLAGLAGGLVFGVGTRLGMRAVALLLHRLPELTAGGTLGFILAMMFFLTPVGLLYPLLRRALPGGTLLRGLLFGVGCMALLGIPFFGGTDTTETVISFGLLPQALAIFAPSFLAYGLVVAAVYERAERRATLRPIGWALLATPLVFELAVVILLVLQNTGLVPPLE